MKTVEEMAEEYAEIMSFDVRGHKRGFIAGYKAAEGNCKEKLDGWISVKERLPTEDDGVTQLWMRGYSLVELVLGCHTVMLDRGQEIEGVLDMNKPDGMWDLCDFTHWMPLPKPPKED